MRDEDEDDEGRDEDFDWSGDEGEGMRRKRMGGMGEKVMMMWGVEEGRVNWD